MLTQRRRRRIGAPGLCLSSIDRSGQHRAKDQIGLGVRQSQVGLQPVRIEATNQATAHAQRRPCIGQNLSHGAGFDQTGVTRPVAIDGRNRRKVSDQQHRQRGPLGDAAVHAVEQMGIEREVPDGVQRVASRVVDIGSAVKSGDRAVLGQHIEPHRIEAACGRIAPLGQGRVLSGHGPQHAQPSAQNRGPDGPFGEMAVALTRQKARPLLFVKLAKGQRDGDLRIGGARQAALFKDEGSVCARIDHLAGFADTGARLVESNIGHNPARAVAVARQTRGGADNLWQAAELGLDLTQLNAEPPQLDLTVLATEELDLAVWQVAAQIAGIVKPLAGDGMPDEAGPRFNRIVPVAERQPIACDEQLAGHMDRARREIGLQDVEALIAQRLAIRHRRPRCVGSVDRMKDRPDRRFGGAAQAEQLRLGRGLAQARRQSDRNPVAAQHHDPQPADQARSGVAGRRHHEVGERRRGVPDRHLVQFDGLGPTDRIALPIDLRDHDRSAGGQHAKDIEDRQIELERRNPQHAVRGVQAEPLVEIRQGIASGAMADRNALGLACAAGCEDHIGQIARRHRSGL
ncbi:hypothetical protein NSU_3825 [Novosphingobium pentaromativorans US6-1]|uniref:Uncharacterized protein n=1 Tax=Novosphingobium pentaromativorans US6-1 TaxID=1088721 RepID=G6EHK4_9SPHN|nr:hypothetical protein NSU_3825 [Novosphingobium pentaromativorans US6-1]